MKKRFLSVFLVLALCLTLLPTAVFADSSGSSGNAAHASHCICGAESCTDSAHNNAITWQAWNSTTSLPDGSGNYYLTADVTLSTTWQPANGTVLCLNGKSIMADNNLGQSTRFSVITVSKIEHLYSDRL